MSKIVTIPLCVEMLNLWAKHGFTQLETMAFLETMVGLWRVNDDLYGITDSFIRTGLDLDPLEVDIFILDTSFYWLPIAQQVRYVALHSFMLRWAVMDYAILLELDNGQ